MGEAGSTVRSVEAGAGRPFRFSLVFEDRRGLLLYWIGGHWAAVLGVVVVSFFGMLGSLFGTLWEEAPVSREFLVFALAAVGAAAVALHLRTRKVLFERRDGTWCWREGWGLLGPGWSAITEERPLRIEREILTAVEGWTLYAGSSRLFSYLGDPSIGRSVGAVFQAAGVPLRTVMKRGRGEE